MNKKILTSTIVLVLLVTTTMTIPLISAQQNNTKQIQDLLKSPDVQPLIGPTIEVFNIICPSNPGPNGENCQLFEGEQIRGPTGPAGSLMQSGDTLDTAVCPPVFQNPETECQWSQTTQVP